MEYLVRIVDEDNVDGGTRDFCRCHSDVLATKNFNAACDAAVEGELVQLIDTSTGAVISEYKPGWLRGSAGTSPG